MAIVTPTSVKLKKIHDVNTQSKISAPLEENIDDAIPLFLTGLYQYIDSYTFPAAKHIQVLLHLASIPSPDALTDLTTPLSLLYRLLDIVSPQQFANVFPSPNYVPSLERSENVPSKDPTKFSVSLWEPLGEVEEETQARIESLEGSDGVWGLLWAYKRPSKKKKKDEKRKAKRPRTRRVKYNDDSEDEEGGRTRGHEDSEDEAESGAGNMVVSEDSWGLIEWLVDLWKKDKQVSEGTFSPLFVAQLRKRKGVQVDDLTYVLAVFRSIYNSPTPEAFGSRQHIVKDLLELISPLIEGSEPVFHVASLPLALLPLLRTLTPIHLSHFFDTLRSCSTPALTAHMLTVCLEDLGGTRSSRADLRRNRHKGSSASGTADLLDTAEWGPLPPPSVLYLIEDLLPLDVSTKKGQGSKKVDQVKAGGIKNKLLLLMVLLKPPKTDLSWERVPAMGDEWIERIRRTMDEANATTLSSLLDAIKYDLANRGDSLSQ